MKKHFILLLAVAAVLSATLSCGQRQQRAKEESKADSLLSALISAADGLHQRLLDDTVLHIKAQLAGTLLRSAPTNTMGVTRNVFNLLCLNPFALLGNGCRTMVGALADATHVLHFCRINHKNNK